MSRRPQNVTEYPRALVVGDASDEEVWVVNLGKLNPHREMQIDLLRAATPWRPISRTERGRRNSSGAWRCCAADAKRVSGKSSLRELQWLQTRAPSHTLPCIVRAHGRPCRTQEGYTRQYKCVEMVKFLDLLPQTFSWALSLASSTSMRSSPRSTSEPHASPWHIAATPTRHTWNVINEDSFRTVFHPVTSEACVRLS